MQSQNYSKDIGYIPIGIEDMIRSAAASRFAKEYGWFMLQYAVYDVSTGRYVVALGD